MRYEPPIQQPFEQPINKGYIIIMKIMDEIGGVVKKKWTVSWKIRIVLLAIPVLIVSSHYLSIKRHKRAQSVNTLYSSLHKIQSSVQQHIFSADVDVLKSFAAPLIEKDTAYTNLWGNTLQKSIADFLVTRNKTAMLIVNHDGLVIDAHRVPRSLDDKVFDVPLMQNRNLFYEGIVYNESIKNFGVVPVFSLEHNMRGFFEVAQVNVSQNKPIWMMIFQHARYLDSLLQESQVPIVLVNKDNMVFSSNIDSWVGRPLLHKPNAVLRQTNFSSVYAFQNKQVLLEHMIIKANSAFDSYKLVVLIPTEMVPQYLLYDVVFYGLIFLLVIAAIFVVWQFRKQEITANQLGKEYKEAFQNIMHSLLVFDEQGIIYAANHRACSMLEVPVEYGITSRKMQDIMGNDFLLELQKWLVQNVYVKGAVFKKRMSIETLAKKQYQVYAKICVLHLEVPYLLLELQDLRDIESREQEAAKLRNRIKEVQSNYTHVFAELAHRLQDNSLVIAGNLEYLNSLLAQEDGKVAVSKIRGAASLMGNLASELAEYSQLEANAIDLEPAEFSLEVLLEEVMDRFYDGACKRHIRLFGRILPEVPARMVGDARRIRRIVSSMLAVAIEKSDYGIVFIRSYAEKIPGNRVKISTEVVHSQKNMQEDDFRHGQTAKLLDFSGSESNGFGLVVAQRLCRMMGGGLKLEIQKEKGVLLKASYLVNAIEGNPRKEQLEQLLSSYELYIVFSEPKIRYLISDIVSPFAPKLIHTDFTMDFFMSANSASPKLLIAEELLREKLRESIAWMPNVKVIFVDSYKVRQGRLLDEIIQVL
jgi:signal transduction histidine kinase